MGANKTASARYYLKGIHIMEDIGFFILLQNKTCQAIISTKGRGEGDESLLILRLLIRQDASGTAVPGRTKKPCDGHRRALGDLLHFRGGPVRRLNDQNTTYIPRWFQESNAAQF
jgi:hypothetical protein